MDIVLLGLVLGMATALLAVGLTLIYMSSRIINFAQGEIGAFAVSLLITLVRVVHLSYWFSLPLALLSSALLSALVERLIIRRLYNAPRLLALIATIGIGELLIVARLLLPAAKVNGKAQFIAGAGTFPVPFGGFRFEFGRVVFGPADLLVVIVGPLVAIGVAWFLRSSVYGLSIRASAENADRARLLGIPIRTVSTLAWTISGLLAGVAAILNAPLVGFSPGQSVGLSLLVPALGAATIARFENVQLAFAYGLGLGVIGEIVTFYSASDGLAEAVEFAILLVALLARKGTRKRTTAAEESSFRLADPIRPLPREIAQHPRWRAVSWTSIAATVAVLLIAPTMMNTSHTLLLATVCAISVVVISLTMLSGWSGQISIGQWAIAGLGGIEGSRLIGIDGVPFWAAFILAGVVGAIAAVVIGIPALRLPGILLAVVTLGFADVCASWLFGQSFIAGTGTLRRPAWINTTDYLYITIAFLIITIAAALALQRGRFGRNLYAVRDNPAQAAALGVSVVRTRLTGFVVCGVMASMGGFLWTAGVTAATPDSYPTVRSLSILSAAVIGGLGSVGGAVLGTAYLVGVPFLLDGVSTYFGLVSSGIGLLVLVLYQPAGLARPASLLRDRLAKLVTGLEPRPVVTPVDLPIQATPTSAPVTRAPALVAS